MMDIERFEPYWSTTKWLAAFLICLWYFAGLGTILFSDLLNDYFLFGFPVGLLLMGVILPIIGVIMIVWYVSAQDQIDQGFGANEDL